MQLKKKIIIQFPHARAFVYGEWSAYEIVLNYYSYNSGGDVQLSFQYGDHVSHNNWTSATDVEHLAALRWLKLYGRHDTGCDVINIGKVPRHRFIIAAEYIAHWWTQIYLIHQQILTYFTTEIDFWFDFLHNSLFTPNYFI